MSAIDIALSIAGKSKNQEIRNDMFEIIKKQCGEWAEFKLHLIAENIQF